ncbi:succinate-semialdehyde dehydrogenase [Paracoccus sp. DK608]|uniref:Succinate-semialdehyde dehydrogenase n=2 Tax=Paracoccus shanxieyensis TaxID=2675752 RepID=A0A6L6IXE8_9RHOB|nr:NAD-dependent succinate-semialdehyde dehydrogenase [Paracoccus shanxieyensis]MTH64291.1 succinate-semialdehyde dehydrogenase [Paracoccus shanxieyensis]MTH87435.1 succinate-semialdehyde dehydrogenase [Paracoccus shanxieyensis]
MRMLDALVSPDLLRQQALIGGEWVDAQDGAVLEVTNPATGAVIGTVPDIPAAQTRAAIAAADAAFQDWRKRPHAERAALLDRWHDLMLAHADDLARILTMEQGKPLSEAKGEIAYGASFITWFAEEARRIDGSVIPAPGNDRRILTLKEPVGVSAIITPWNFPNAMITRKVAPALAAGCTVVIKPSEMTPFSALALGVLAERAGIPAGVVNIVTGLPTAIGAELTASPVVRKLSFTGSTRVGSLLMAQSAPTVKRLSLELGGNAPFIIFDDADLDRAVEGAIASKFRNGGQTCVCSNRILVQAGVHDAFAEKLSARVSAMKVGPGTDPGTEIGPMINRAAIDKIDRHIADAVAKGATIAAQAATPAGQYAAPTVLTGATTEMELASEETFGPVAPLFRFQTEDEAIALANATPFGLAAYFYTEDIRRAWRVGEALEFGMVGLNTGAISTTVSPFGGVKQSGLGREGARQGIDEYLEVKAFHMGL